MAQGQHFLGAAEQHIVLTHNAAATHRADTQLLRAALLAHLRAVVDILIAVASLGVDGIGDHQGRAAGGIQFIVMVLAARFDKSQEIEVLKAESVMVRTDIYRVMGAAMQADSTSLGLEFFTEKQMRASWQENYESNYALIADCVASTGSSVLMYQNAYIEAKYTAVSAGKTLSGSEISEEKYAYLAAVDCPEDIKSTDYLRVETFTYKDFVKKIKSGYEQAGLHEEAPFQDIQIVSKTDSGYVTKIQAGNVIMSGTEFAKILGLSSAAMTIENSNGKIKITTKGLGDGMGVSLYTADFMAKQGSSYEQILKAFYSGITIVSQ